jgi:RNase P subunit RPR2
MLNGVETFLDCLSTKHLPIAPQISPREWYLSQASSLSARVNTKLFASTKKQHCEQAHRPPATPYTIAYRVTGQTSQPATCLK